jgi:PAS domain S-box-containing protein
MMKHLGGIFRRVSLTTKIVLLTAVVGLVLWAFTDWYQARTLGDIYRAQLYEDLREHGVEERNLLDKHFKAYFKLGTMVVSGKRFHDYLDNIEGSWHEGEAVQVKYHKRQPMWFPEPSLLRPFAQARYVLLLDSRKTIREAYIREKDALPEFLLAPYKNLPQLEWGNSFLTSVDGAPYAITSESVMDSSGKPRAVLLLATPIDDEFLCLSQAPYLHGDTIALIGGIKPTIIASIDPKLLPPGTIVDDLKDKYLVIGQAFFDYGNSDLLIRHAIFAPKEKIRTMTEAFISKERYKRTATTLAIIATFSIIMLQISRRMRGVTHRIEDFSREALGSGLRGTVKGDQLTVLEERFQQLTEEVVERTTQLETANAQLQTLIHAIPGAVFFKDAQGRHLVVNKACADLVGSNEEEILGKTVEEIMPPDIAEECRRSDEEVISSHGTVRTEEDNGGAVLETIKSPLFDDSGNYQGMVGLAFDITERRKAEEALREGEERFRSVFENAAAGMVLTDAESRFLQVNGAMCRILGYSEEELTGMSFQDITHSKDIKTSLDALQDLFSGEMDTCGFEKRYITKSGETGWALLNVTAIRDSDGEFLYSLAEVHDITLRKWLEEAVMESEEKYRALIENANDAIFLADAETGVIIEANKQAEEMLNMPIDEIIGMHQSKLHPEDERTDSVAGFKESATRGKMSALELRDEFHVLTKDGQKVPVDISASTVELEGGKKLAVAIFHDITKRKEAEEALKEGKQFLSNVLNCIQDGISIISKDFTVLMVNPATEKWYPHRMPLVGKKCYEAFRYRTERCDPCPAAKAMDSGQSTYEVVPFFRPDGTVGSGELHTFPLMDPETGKVTGVIEYFRDITEKVGLQEEAIRAAQLASVGELAAGVAHEINNPINGIINYAQILANRLGHDDTEGELAQRIIKEGDRISDIVRALLSFTREDRAINSLHVNVLMSEVFMLTTSQLVKDGINVRTEVPSKLPALKGNQRQIEQVFLNVINNARHALNEKYTGAHENKTLEISGTKVVVDEAPYVRMTFHDRGAGIPDAIIDKVTDPFFTTKEKGVGTGLGLSISQSIINSHGGRLFIESTEGEFTKVVIDLPEGEGL